ncbi:MAG: MBL fold metallo-hydrolase [Desulfovibrionaceae bacterium]|nr:MBL fold metallo-hydrolase [Desulfovibrionaceae bacterium]
MSLACFPLGPLQTNSYVLHTTTQAVVIDVGGDPQPIMEYLHNNQLALSAICITHMHFDHIYGVAHLARHTQAPVYAPFGDEPIADTEASRGGIWGFPLVEPFESQDLPLGDLTFGDLKCKVLSTPGHTPGSVSLYFAEENLVFSGDALFYHSVGRTDFPLGNFEELRSAIAKELFSLPPTCRVLPGHGPETTIEEERMHNPICGEFCS